MNVNILGISELKWTGMVEFNSDDIISTTAGRNPSEEMEEPSWSTKVHLVKAMVFPAVMYGHESWTIRKAESQRIDAFELWC